MTPTLVNFLQGLTFQLTLDYKINNTTWMFGGPVKDTEKAMKKARNHMRGLQKYMDVAGNLGSDPRMSFPLTCLVEYKGYSVLCYAAPPDPAFKYSTISGFGYLQQLDQGQKSPPGSLHNFSASLKKASEQMNLAPSTVMSKIVYSAVDLDAYLGGDSRYIVRGHFIYFLGIISQVSGTLCPPNILSLYRLGRRSFILSLKAYCTTS